MADTGTLLASGIVALLTSAIINILSVYYQSRLTEQRESKRAQEEWYNEIIRTARDVKRASIRLNRGQELEIESVGIKFDTGDETLQNLGLLIDDLEKVNSEAPTECRDGTVYQAVRKVVDRCKNPTTGTTDMDTTTDLSDFVYEQGHLIEEAAESQRDAL